MLMLLTCGSKMKSGNRIKDYIPADRHQNSRELSTDNFWDEQALPKDSSELPLLDFAKLATATDNFSEINKIGAGGFGPVYKVITVC